MALGRNRSDAPRRRVRPGIRSPAVRRLARRSGRLGAAMGAASAVTTAVLAVSGSAPARAGIASEQAKASQLAQQIVADGAAVRQAVSEEDAAQAKVSSLAAQVATTTARLATYRRADARAARRLKGLAVHAYITGEDAGSPSAMFVGGSADALVARAEYSHVAQGDLAAALDTYRTDEQQTHAEVVTLESQQTQASAAAAQLAGAGQQAQAELARDTALLDQVKGDIAVLQAAAAAQAQQAANREAALAAQRAQRQLAPPPPSKAVAAPAASPQAQAASSPAASSPAASPPGGPAATPGGYANPLRSISGLSPERIDQGVDYQGFGPLYAIGPGVVLNTVNAGWPGGTFITYRLTAGPAAGLVVYAAEDIQPAVQVGQHVTPTTVIGTLYEGPDGIETGWADPAGTGYTMAYDSGQFGGSNSSAFGANFSQLLVALGAPGGNLQNNPPTGSLPSNWPSW